MVPLVAKDFNALCEQHELTFRQAAILSFMIARRFVETDPYDIGKFFDHDKSIHEDLDVLSEKGLVENYDRWTYWVHGVQSPLSGD